MWKQHLEAMSELNGPHFNGGMAPMAKYAQYLFNLQHNTARTIMQQRMHLTAYAAAQHHHFAWAWVVKSWDRKLKVAYRRLSEAEHGWSYTRQQLDATHVEVDQRTHMIIHLEHANEE
jgi:hypothetical protein